ncbi:MAG: hypothetical protein N3C60_02915 [Calditerrivibrio sp.]|nr:hypothetical protein [Calditerrivibrio sp.]
MSSYENVKFVKLISGDTVIGVYDEENKRLNDVAIIQTIPTTAGMQIAILPFGFPYEDEIQGSIDATFIMYEYKKFPEEIVNKYLEAKSNIRITSNLGDLSGFGNKGGKGGLIL